MDQSPSAFDVIAPFAQSLFVKKCAYLRTGFTAKQRARLRESMIYDLRKCSDMLSPGVKPFLVSVAAADRAGGLGVDLATMTWHDQPKFDPGRQIFHFEHYAPLAQMRDQILDKETVSEVEQLLDEELLVAWILKSENARLSALGYNSKRLDPAAAYHEAGITLLSA